MRTDDYAKAIRTASLKTLEVAHATKISERATLRIDIEEMLRDRLIDLELKESRAANEAIANGASKTAVGRAMGTANWQTIEAVLARTAGDVPTEDRVIDPLDARYSFDAEGKTLTVTYSGEAWTNACWELEWDERAALNAGLNVAEFGWTFQPNGRPILKSIGPIFLPEFSNNHPVAMAVMRDDTEAVAWLEGKLAA